MASTVPCCTHFKIFSIISKSGYYTQVFCGAKKKNLVISFSKSIFKLYLLNYIYISPLPNPRTEKTEKAQENSQNSPRDFKRICCILRSKLQNKPAILQHNTSCPEFKHPQRNSQRNCCSRTRSYASAIYAVASGPCAWRASRHPSFIGASSCW